MADLDHRLQTEKINEGNQDAGFSDDAKGKFVVLRRVSHLK